MSTKEDNMPILNWPPSRGPMPEWMAKKPEYKYPKSYRVIIERPIVKEARAEVEKDAIESLVSVIKERKLLTGLKESVFKIEKKTKDKNKYIDLEVDLNVSVEELCKISLYQAMYLVNGWSRDERNDDNKQYMSKRGMVHSLPDLPITTEISYPLSSKLKVMIHPYTIKRTKHIDLSGDCHDNDKDEIDIVEHDPNIYMDVSYFLWRIAQEYKYIYKNHKKFGVWGHCLGDLVFEGVKFNKNGTAELCIGS